MIIYSILLGLIVISIAVPAVSVGRRALALRRVALAPTDGESLYHRVVLPGVDYLAYRFATSFRDVARLSSYYILRFCHRGITLLKYGIITIEQKFARVLDPVKHRSHLHHGAPSLFDQTWTDRR